MPRYDNKLYRFEEAIMKKAGRERDSILQEVEALRASEIKSAETGYLQEEARRVKDELSQMGESFNRELAQKTAEYRREVLRRRDEMAQSVFAAARLKLEAFAASGAPYTDWMTEKVRTMGTLYPGEGAMLFIMARDAGLAEQLAKSYGGGCEVTVSEDFEIGGVILFHPATGLIVDESLDSALDEQRDYFLEHSGLVEAPGAEAR